MFFSCDVQAHLCGRSCKLSGKNGCQEACTKVKLSLRIQTAYTEVNLLQRVDHSEDEDHMCSATTHECGMVCGIDIDIESGCLCPFISLAALQTSGFITIDPSPVLGHALFLGIGPIFTLIGFVLMVA